MNADLPGAGHGNSLIDAVADAFPLLVKGDDPGFMTRVALLTRPPESKTDEPAKAEPGGDGNGL